jgi:hypothetical protein
VPNAVSPLEDTCVARLAVALISTLFLLVTGCAAAEPAADGLWPATPYIHPAAKEEAMTTEEMSRMTTTGRRSGLLWRHAGGRNPASAPAAELEHELMVLSRHRTSEGVVTYARCNCGELQIWLTGTGRPAHTLIKSIRGPERPPA